MLRADKISVAYGSHRALEDVSLRVSPGEIVVILGANGAGKSTLLKTIAGLIRPAAGGVVAVNDNELTGLAPNRIVERGLALVPEGRGVFADLTVRENLDLGGHHLEKDELDKQIHWLFDLFPILKERQGQMAQTLSGGEQQMLAIGRALMMKPKILILDEPTLGLAPIILEQLSKALERLRQTTKITVLLGEQNVTFALPHADRVYVLEHARIVWEGDPGRFAQEAGAGYL